MDLMSKTHEKNYKRKIKLDLTLGMNIPYRKV
jgi:hypothetical protein